MNGKSKGKDKYYKGKTTENAIHSQPAFAVRKQTKTSQLKMYRKVSSFAK